MADVSEQIVREYFETHGFYIWQPCKYQVAARKKRDDEEIDLIITNPRVKDQKLPGRLIWVSSDLARVRQAVVGIRAWHTDKFTPAVLETSPEIFRFAQPEVLRKTDAILKDAPVAKILCLSGLSSNRQMRGEIIEILRKNGIDGVLTFKNMLLELMAYVKASHGYEKSDLLQTLRILKNYNLLKTAQLELFDKK